LGLGFCGMAMMRETLTLDRKIALGKREGADAALCDRFTILPKRYRYKSGYLQPSSSQAK
ncbi:MAG: hypothetical protein MK135_00365, partial [Polyangiaceae bacterium]|nr:hypothetical protein [Polyangiaceae bacterium]